MQTINQTIYNRCLHLLSIREHSKQELFTKLLIKGFTESDSLPAIKLLSEQDYQSDTRYAQSYARSRLNKGYGAVFIAYQLKQKGITNDIIAEVLNTITEDWLEVLEKVYFKKYKTHTNITRLEWAKRSRFLVQRGFDYTLIQALFQKLNQ